MSNTDFTNTYTGTIQYDTITTSGEYAITGEGAQGGESSFGEEGGKGAAVSGDVYLQSGTVLEIIVGGKGAGSGGGIGEGSRDAVVGGGGGGSFVFETNGAGGIGTLLAVAGGGGGAGSSGNGGAGGAVPTGGNGGGLAPGGGGKAGAPGAGGFLGGGGGGYTGGNGGGKGSTGMGGANGGTGFGGGLASPSALQGTAGNGGFGGGGGGGYEGGGAGGGYGGGGGGGAGNGGSNGGGGGGSYLAPTLTDTSEAAGAHAGYGLVTIELVCYLRGTNILTPTGERRVEDLKIGDRVVTRFGGVQPIKWIGRQKFENVGLDHAPVRFRPGSLGDDMPARDLFVSPGHSMLVGGTLILASTLVNGVTITRDEAGTDIEYFQLDLGRHDCVIAEGTWSETYADAPGLRDVFHNAAEFAALYPDEPPAAALRLCAPRPEHGADLYAALAPVVARAEATITPGKLRGFVDVIEGEWLLHGWAQDAGHPELPVQLDIVLNAKVIGTVLACEFREDLRQAGIGKCSFVFNSPVRLRRELWPTIQVRRSTDGAALDIAETIRGDGKPGLRLVA